MGIPWILRRLDFDSKADDDGLWVSWIDGGWYSGFATICSIVLCIELSRRLDQTRITMADTKTSVASSNWLLWLYINEIEHTRDDLKDGGWWWATETTTRRGVLLLFVGVSAERTTFAEHFGQPELPRAADLLELLDEVDGVDVELGLRLAGAVRVVHEVRRARHAGLTARPDRYSPRALFPPSRAATARPSARLRETSEHCGPPAPRSPGAPSAAPGLPAECAVPVPCPRGAVTQPGTDHATLCTRILYFTIYSPRSEKLTFSRNGSATGNWNNKQNARITFSAIFSQIYQF